MMPEYEVKQTNSLREDIVISICFFDLSATEETFQAVQKLARELDKVYRFREIIVISDNGDHTKFIKLVEHVPDLRLFVTHQGTGYYEQRAVAAEEAIGDIVVITSLSELPSLDIETLITLAEQSSSIVIAKSSMHDGIFTRLFAPLEALGRISRFNIASNYLQTITIPRSLLNKLLVHSEPQLALRFPPVDSSIPLEFVAVEGDVAKRSRTHGFSQRLQLLQKLLMNLAPAILSLVSLTSVMITLFGFSYALYTISSWIFIQTIAPGWLSLSAMLSISSMFMGISILGLSLGMSNIIKKQSIKREDRISLEINKIDIFGKVASDLNIEESSGGQEAGNSVIN